MNMTSHVLMDQDKHESWDEPSPFSSIDASSRGNDGMSGPRVEKITTTEAAAATTAVVMDEDNHRNDGLPMLVLHIGPHKTATSTIQCALTRYREKLYKEASVAYLGRMYYHCKMMNVPKKDRFKELEFDTRDFFGACFDDKSSPSKCRESEFWKSLEKKLEYFSGRNETVVLSDEIFSRTIQHVDESGVDNLSMLFELFDKYYPGRVRMVLVYRRYFEWLVSWWNSFNKPYRNYIMNPDNPYKPQFQNWPEDGGKIVNTFLHILIGLKEGTGWVSKSARGNLHPVEYLRLLWANHSFSRENTMLLNMRNMAHDGEDIATGFVRQILPSPSYLAGDVFAKATGEDVGFAGRPNPSRNIDFDRLAVAAHKQGLLAASTIGTTMPRFKVAELAEQHLLKKLNTTIELLPKICPNENLLHELLNNSLKYEQRIYPDLRSEEASGEHRSAFWKAHGQGKFCHMDLDKIIEDDAVREFFTTDIATFLVAD